MTVQDEIGFIKQSLNSSYLVSSDTTPPQISDVRRINPVGSPVLPIENVTITANITDDSSGVRYATLFWATAKFGDFSQARHSCTYPSSGCQLGFIREKDVQRNIIFNATQLEQFRFL